MTLTGSNIASVGISTVMMLVPLLEILNHKVIGDIIVRMNWNHRGAESGMIKVT